VGDEDVFKLKSWFAEVSVPCLLPLTGKQINPYAILLIEDDNHFVRVYTC